MKWETALYDDKCSMIDLCVGAAAVAKQRRHLGQIREHPYQRAGALS